MSFLQKVFPFLQRNLLRNVLKESHSINTASFENSSRTMSTCLTPLSRIHIDPAKNQHFQMFPTRAPCSHLNLVPDTFFIQPSRSYKPKMSLKLRCSGCFFVTRKGRRYVECKLKPRHKQRQIIHKRNLFRDDYSKGNIKQALFWKHKEDRWYRQGNNQYARMDWLGDRLGRDI